jgi:hypothetical protein
MRSPCVRGKRFPDAPAVKREAEEDWGRALALSGEGMLTLALAERTN